MSGLSGWRMPSNTEIGQSHEENQVSITSSSCVRSFAWSEDFWPLNLAFASTTASSRVLATTNSPLGRYHAGILCPHQSCREMHQSLTFSIQCRYMFLYFAG